MYGWGLVLCECGLVVGNYLKYVVTMWAMPVAVIILKACESTFFTERLSMKPIAVGVKMSFGVFGVII